MKKISVIVISVLLSVFSATAQNIEEFFAKQKGKENVEYIELSSEAIETISTFSKMASWIGKFKSDVSKEELQIVGLFSTILDDVESFDFLIANNDKVDLRKEFKNLKIEKSHKYRLFGEKVDKTQEIIVYGQKNKKKSLKNLLVLISDIDDNSTIITNIKGEIKLENVAKIIEIAHERDQKRG